MWLIIKHQITRNNQQQKEATGIGQRKGKRGQQDLYILKY